MNKENLADIAYAIKVCTKYLKEKKKVDCTFKDVARYVQSCWSSGTIPTAEDYVSKKAEARDAEIKRVIDICIDFYEKGKGMADPTFKDINEYVVNSRERGEWPTVDGYDDYQNAKAQEKKQARVRR